MKYIFVLVLSIVSLNSNAITIEQCSNQDADSSQVVSDDFIFCINRNFVKLRNLLELDRYVLPRCRNLDYSSVDFLFIDCINDNLKKAGDLLKVRITYCPNYSTEQINSVFVGCINGRFQKLSTAINGLNFNY
jgi:hypothetical protein